MVVVTRPEPARSLAALQPPAQQPRAVPDFLHLCREAGSGRLAGLALLGAILVVLLNVRLAPGAAAPAPVPAPARTDRWVEIDNPSPLFVLDSAAFGKLPRLYEARRAEHGGGRRDMLTFGRFDGSGDSYLFLSLAKAGAATPPAPFFVALARPAAEAALALTRSGEPTPLATRFGAFEIADVTLARQAIQASCLGFRFDAEASRFHIAGLACGGARRPLERARLACSLDGLSLVSADADSNLGLFFQSAKPRRDRLCGDDRPERHAARKKGDLAITRAGP